MKIFKLNTESSFFEKNLCLAIGNFDGFHKGHQAILKLLKNLSNKKNLSSAIMSFDPHPRTFFDNTEENFNIYIKNDKLNFLKDFGIKIYIDFIFNKKLVEFSSEEFIEKILINKLKIKDLVVGSDFKFGKDRTGNVEVLQKLSKKYSYNIHLVETVMLKNNINKYSSSIIRTDIKDGKMQNVYNSLGRHWHISGKIISGLKKAREINFPTANMKPGKHILPKKGVYCVEVIYSGKKYLGISNFGQRPTVDGNKLLLETHIFNFDEEIYGKDLTVRFLTFIRHEKKFENFEKLTLQIQKDIKIAKKYHQL